MAGAAGFLQKPYDLVHLKRALELALNLDDADD